MMKRKNAQETEGKKGIMEWMHAAKKIMWKKRLGQKDGWRNWFRKMGKYHQEAKLKSSKRDTSKKEAPKEEKDLRARGVKVADEVMEVMMQEVGDLRKRSPYGTQPETVLNVISSKFKTITQTTKYKNAPLTESQKVMDKLESDLKMLNRNNRGRRSSWKKVDAIMENVEDYLEKMKDETIDDKNDQKLTKDIVIKVNVFNKNLMKFLNQITQMKDRVRFATSTAVADHIQREMSGKIESEKARLRETIGKSHPAIAVINDLMKELGEKWDLLKSDMVLNPDKYKGLVYDEAKSVLKDLQEEFNEEAKDSLDNEKNQNKGMHKMKVQGKRAKREEDPNEFKPRNARLFKFWNRSHRKTSNETKAHHNKIKKETHNFFNNVKKSHWWSVLKKRYKPKRKSKAKDSQPKSNYRKMVKSSVENKRFGNSTMGAAAATRYDKYIHSKMQLRSKKRQGTAQPASKRYRKRYQRRASRSILRRPHVRSNSQNTNATQWLDSKMAPIYKKYGRESRVAEKKRQYYLRIYKSMQKRKPATTGRYRRTNNYSATDYKKKYQRQPSTTFSTSVYRRNYTIMPKRNVDSSNLDVDTWMEEKMAPIYKKYGRESRVAQKKRQYYLKIYKSMQKRKQISKRGYQSTHKPNRHSGNAYKGKYRTRYTTSPSTSILRRSYTNTRQHPKTNVDYLIERKMAPIYKKYGRNSRITQKKKEYYQRMYKSKRFNADGVSKYNNRLPKPGHAIGPDWVNKKMVYVNQQFGPDSTTAKKYKTYWNKKYQAIKSKYHGTTGRDRLVTKPTSPWMSKKIYYEKRYQPVRASLPIIDFDYFNKTHQMNSSNVTTNDEVQAKKLEKTKKLILKSNKARREGKPKKPKSKRHVKNDKKKKVENYLKGLGKKLKGGFNKFVSGAKKWWKKTQDNMKKKHDEAKKKRTKNYLKNKTSYLAKHRSRKWHQHFGGKFHQKSMYTFCKLLPSKLLFIYLIGGHVFFGDWIKVMVKFVYGITTCNHERTSKCKQGEIMSEISSCFCDLMWQSHHAPRGQICKSLSDVTKSNIVKLGTMIVRKHMPAGISKKFIHEYTMALNDYSFAKDFMTLPMTPENLNISVRHIHKGVDSAFASLKKQNVSVDNVAFTLPTIMQQLMANMNNDMMNAVSRLMTTLQGIFYRHIPINKIML